MPPADWQTVAKALDEALELPTIEQDEWLARLHSADPGLADEVGELLAVRRRPQFSEFLSGTFPRPIDPPKEASMVGKLVGAYLIDAQIGRGGMGSVWRAHRTDGRYEGEVALKFVHAAYLGNSGEARFRHEGVLLGRLQHPHIARLLDAGVFEGQPYLVLEYVRGLPIDKYCTQRGLQVRERCRLFLDVLGAVAHAHAHLIVHRDLKPSNVLIAESGHVKLLDFGVAKLLEEDPDAAITQASVVALTPQYASPEQLLGQPVTTSSDVYALGLMLYVLLTGAHPAGKTTSSAALMRAVVHEEPKRASERSGLDATARRALQGDLDNILGKALKKDPDERYGSAQAFAEDLTRFLANQPVHAAADSTAYRAGKFVKRHRTAVLLSGAAVIALAATSVFALVQLFEARAQRDVAEYEAIHASAHSELSEFLLGDSLAQAPREAVEGRLNRARDMIHRRFAADPPLQAGLLIGLSGRYIDAGDMKGAAAVMQEAEVIARNTGDPDLNASIACGKAEDAVEAGDLPAARRSEAEGLRNIARLSTPGPGLIAECAMATAVIAERESNFPKATAVLHASLQALKAAGVERTPRYTSVAHEYARALLLSGDFGHAWRAEQGVLYQVAATGRDDSDAYFAMINVGATALIDGGAPKKALDLIRATTAKAQRDAPNALLPFYIEASRCLAGWHAGEVREADHDLMRYADTAESQGLFSAITTYRSAAVRAALGRGDTEEARRDLNSLRGFISGRGPGAIGRTDTLRALLAGALVASAGGDAPAAKQALERAESLVPVAERSSERAWSMVLLAAAEIRYAAGDYQGALDAARQAGQRTRQEAVDPQASRWLGAALLWEARAEAALGLSASAREHAAQSWSQLNATVAPDHPQLAAARQLQTSQR